MDSLTLANTFATVVQLVGMFKQERKDAKEVDDQKFIEWLSYHRHDEVKNLICSTAGLHAEVTNLLRQDNVVILSKLDSINTILAKMLSQVEGFRGVSKVLMPGTELSDQAVSLLRQLVASGSRNLIYGEVNGGAILQPDDGEPFTFTDGVFLSDDIDSLVDCGFLTFRDEADITKTFGITRAGAAFIRTLGQSP